MFYNIYLIESTTFLILYCAVKPFLSLHLEYFDIDKDNSWTPGDQVYGGNITIPEGLKSLDYSFDGNKDLETVPKIPDSVETAHAAFKGCTKIERAAKNAKTGEHSSAGEVAAGVGTSIGGAAVAGAMACSVVPGAGTLVGAVAGTAVGVGSAVASVGGRDSQTER